MLDIIYKESDLENLSRVLIKELPSKIVCFEAPMGAGNNADKSYFESARGI